MHTFEDPQVSRRGFFAATTALLAAVPIFGGLFVAARAMLAPAFREQPQKMALCKLSDVPEKGLLRRAVSYKIRRGPAIESVTKVVFVTREEKDIIAISARCTHLGCPVTHQEDDEEVPLFCKCHDGAFDRHGKVLSGPPKDPLDRLEIEVPEAEDGTIYLLDL